MRLHEFPISENALPRVFVPPRRVDEWKQLAEDEVARVVQDPNSWYANFRDQIGQGYDMMTDQAQLKAFIRNVPNSTDKDVLVRSTLRDITLDDLAVAMQADTTFDFRCVQAHLYGDGFLDAGMLQVYETFLPDDPMHFVGMVWVAIRSPAPSMVTSRDFIYFLYTGTTYDTDGNRLLFRFIRSMPMEDLRVDDIELPQLVRGKVSYLHLYRQHADSPHIDAFTRCRHSSAGRMPSFVVTRTLRLMFPGLMNIETMLEARALMSFGLARINTTRAVRPEGLPVPPAQRATAFAHPNSCGVCFKRFSLTRTKQECRCCRRTVCRRCTKALWMFDELKRESEIGVAKLRFCFNCTRYARDEARKEAQRAGRMPGQVLNASPTHSSSTGTRFLAADSNSSNHSQNKRNPDPALSASSHSHSSASSSHCPTNKQTITTATETFSIRQTADSLPPSVPGGDDCRSISTDAEWLSHAGSMSIESRFLAELPQLSSSDSYAGSFTSASVVSERVEVDIDEGFIPLVPQLEGSISDDQEGSQISSELEEHSGDLIPLGSFTLSRSHSHSSRSGSDQQDGSSIHSSEDANRSTS